MVAVVRRAGIVLVLGWLAVLFTAGAVQAAPAGADAPSQPAYLAEQLRHAPVYVSDQMPRVVPRSTAPAFAAQAKRLRVPTYVVVLPFTSSGSGSGLLAAIHDHLGRKGLYVAVSETGLSEVQSYGVSVPGAADAKTATLYELPYDATPREVFRHFVDLLTSGRAHQRAEAARAAYGGADNSHEPPALHTTQTDRENQSFLTGTLVAGVPLSALLITHHARGRRRPRPGSVPPRGWPLPVGAVVLAGLLALAASQVFSDTSTGDGSVPTAADLRARIDRVSAGLRHDPLYVDPESPSPLDAAERAELRERLATLPVPVLVVALPSSMDDESGGDQDRLAAALHDRLHRDALFVTAELPSGYVSVANHGTHVDTSALHDASRDPAAGERDLSTLGPRLDKLLASVAKAPKTETAGAPLPPSPVEDPVAQRKLPGLFTGDFHPGLFIGALAALLLFGLVVAVGAILRAVGRRGARAAAAAAAPVEPRPAWLRRTAREELAALTVALEPATELSEAARRRAWECLDAAALLIDGDSDGLIDDDATPASLACAIVLARVGRTAAREPSAATHVCHRNPLHGAAAGPAGKRPAGGRGAVPRPVCAACRETPGEMLRLPEPDASGHRGHSPYPGHPGPLATLAKGTGIDQLTREVRESFGVN